MEMKINVVDRTVANVLLDLGVIENDQFLDFCTNDFFDWSQHESIKQMEEIYLNLKKKEEEEKEKEYSCRNVKSDGIDKYSEELSSDGLKDLIDKIISDDEKEDEELTVIPIYKTSEEFKKGTSHGSVGFVLGKEDKEEEEDMDKWMDDLNNRLDQIKRSFEQEERGMIGKDFKSDVDVEEEEVYINGYVNGNKVEIDSDMRTLRKILNTFTVRSKIGNDGDGEIGSVNVVGYFNNWDREVTVKGHIDDIRDAFDYIHTQAKMDMFNGELSEEDFEELEFCINNI